MRLDTQTWRALSTLLDQALDLPQDAHEAWLGSLPAGQASLEPMLRELLRRRAAPETRDFLNGPAFAITESSQSAYDSHTAGQVIGAYRLIREIGQGGMGTVWLAERVDGLVKRPIALKLPHLLGSRDALAERFARERDILGALEHPNIARLYDAGFGSDGRPYLALEFVEGVPITVACTERGLDLRERITLFMQAIRAVQHAHVHLALHRDIKPSNILVTSAGDVKLLDFGIAKLMADGRAQETELTQFAGRALTPDYASPEQITGQTLTTASDVYSLGVVLYELLTGTKPYRLKRGTRAELEEAILGQEIERASSVAARAPHHRRQPWHIEGDLDAILLKALQKDPQARYATASSFADDLARYLDGQAVLAQPDSRWYRAKRFVRKHRVSVSLGAGVASLLVAASVVSLLAMQRAERSAEQARRDGSRSLAVQNFLTDLFRANSLERRSTGSKSEPTASDLLDRGVEQLDRGMSDAADVRAYLYRLIGEMFEELGQHERSISAHTKSVAEARRAHGAESREAALAMLELAWVRHFVDRSDEPWKMVEQARTILAKVAPGSADYAQTLYFESAFFRLADPPRAVRTGEDAVRLIEASSERGVRYAFALGVLADAYRFAGRHAAATARDRDSIAAYEAIYSPDARQVAERRIVMARSLQAQLRLAESEDTTRAVLRQLVARPLERRDEITWTHVQLGQVMWLRGDFGSAQKQFELAVEASRDIPRTDSFTPEQLIATLAVESLAAGDVPATLARLSTLLASLDREVPLIQILVLSNLARAHLMAGNIARGRLYIERALASLAVKGAPLHIRFRTLAIAAEFAARAGDRVEALRRLNDIRELRSTDTSALRLELEFALLEARVFGELGDWSEVRKLLQPWLDREWKPPLEMPVPARAEALLWVGLAAMEARSSDARQLLAASVDLLRKTDVPASPRRLRAEHALTSIPR